MISSRVYAAGPSNFFPSLRRGPSRASPEMLFPLPPSIPMTDSSFLMTAYSIFHRPRTTLSIIDTLLVAARGSWLVSSHTPKSILFCLFLNDPCKFKPCTSSILVIAPSHPRGHHHSCKQQTSSNPPRDGPSHRYRTLTAE